MNKTVGPITTISTREILDELDHAITNHMIWLKEWHRVFLCQDPPFAKDLAFDPHHLCRFGSWYVKNQHRGLVNQPAIRNLADRHKEMHDLGQDIVDHHMADTPVARDKYDAFMDKASSFIAQARRLEKAFMTAASDLDRLTGLHNRQAMEIDLEKERERHLRNGHPCSIAIGDIDHFKKINDTHGHTIGDKVLFSVAEVFLKHVRPYDTAYRYGGEEFLFCLVDTDAKETHEIMERLRLSLAMLRVPIDASEDVQVTASFGIAQMSEFASVKEAIEHADQALYAAKKNGRNQTLVWTA
jgi:diguanylate cyclase